MLYDGKRRRMPGGFVCFTTGLLLHSDTHVARKARDATLRRTCNSLSPSSALATWPVGSVLYLGSTGAVCSLSSACECTAQAVRARAAL
jgi:hypothetical protein